MEGGSEGGREGRTGIEAGARRGHVEEGAADVHCVGALGDDDGGGLGRKGGRGGGGEGERKKKRKGE